MAEHAQYFADDKARRVYMAKRILSKFMAVVMTCSMALSLGNVGGSRDLG